eukprot:1193242-Prorocentrum_minimum.AAC.7
MNTHEHTHTHTHVHTLSLSLDGLECKQQQGCKDCNSTLDTQCKQGGAMLSSTTRTIDTVPARGAGDWGAVLRHRLHRAHAGGHHRRSQQQPMAPRARHAPPARVRKGAVLQPLDLSRARI